MLKQLLSFFSPKLKEKKPLVLQNHFKFAVRMIAENSQHKTGPKFLYSEHQLLLQKYGDEYRKTNEYKFLSEEFNSVPDLSLRAMYREKILSTSDTNSFSS